MANQQASAQSQSQQSAGGSTVSTAASVTGSGAPNSSAVSVAGASNTSQNPQQQHQVVSASQAVAVAAVVASASAPAILELITCKFTTPAHMVNDGRMLECGATACYQCIVNHKDPDKNVKCPYCQGIHKITHDSKLILNKPLNNFLKSNFHNQATTITVQNKQPQQQQTQQQQHLANNFVKYVDDSLLAIEAEKLQTQNASIENVEHYLNVFENDMKMRIDAMKMQFEKLSDHFVQNMKLMRKELLRCNESTNQEHNMLGQYHLSYIKTPHQQQQQQQQMQHNHHHQQQQQHQVQQQQQQHRQSNHLNNFTTNTSSAPGNASSLLNTNASTATSKTNVSLLNESLSFNGQSASASSNANSANNANNNNANNNNNSNNNNNANNNTTTFVSMIQNYSNSNSFKCEQDEMDEIDAELNVKPVSFNQTQKRHLNKEQAQFNKFVREEVTKRFGENFLLQHEVNQLESSIMDIIKNEAISSFLPKDTPPARAWTLAKVSLRSLKRDLRRKQGQMYKKNDCQQINIHPYLNA